MAQKLLLIDENCHLLTLVGDYLSNLGYEVHRASESDEAEALFKNYRYSVVVSGTDWENFAGSGRTLNRYIEQLNYRPRIVRLEESHSNPCVAPEPDDDSPLVIEKPSSLLLLRDLKTRSGKDVL
jgi:DNA-binding NtrC family response regulator